MHILYVYTYTYIYIHILTLANRSQVVFWRAVAGALGRLDGLQPTRSDVTGHGTGLHCADLALETSQRPMAGTLQGP